MLYLQSFDTFDPFLKLLFKTLIKEGKVKDYEAPISSDGSLPQTREFSETDCEEQNNE